MSTLSWYDHERAFLRLISVIMPYLTWRYRHYDKLFGYDYYLNALCKSLAQKSQRGIPLNLSIENVDKEFWKCEDKRIRWGI